MKAISKYLFIPSVSLLMAGNISIAAAAQFTQQELAYTPATSQIVLFRQGIVITLYNRDR